MATVNTTGYFVTVSSIVADFDLKTELGVISNCSAIKFFPGATDDVLVVKEQKASGSVITKLLSTDGEGRIDSGKDIGKSQSPFIDVSECTLTAGAIVVFVLKSRVS